MKVWKIFFNLIGWSLIVLSTIGCAIGGANTLFVQYMSLGLLFIIFAELKCKGN